MPGMPTSHLPTAPEPAVRLPDATTDELLRAVAAAHGKHDAYVEASGGRLTSPAWDRAADGTPPAFAELGVRVGDVVSLLLPSGIDYAICYLAAMRLGAITSGINTRLGPAEVASILRRSEPRLLVAESGAQTPSDGLRTLDRSELPALRG